MHRPDTPGSIDGEFSDGEPEIEDDGTIIDAAIMEGIVETIIHPIEASGEAPVKGDHSQLTKAIFALSANSGLLRNNILNPHGEISRRGESFVLLGSAGAAEQYVMDRWRAYPGTDGDCTVDLAANDTSVSTNPQFSNRVLHWTQDVQSSDAPALKQRMWTLSAFSGKTVKLTLRARASKAITVVPRLRQHFGIGEATNAEVSTEGNISLTTSWTTFERTFSVDSIAGVALGTGPVWTALELDFPDSDTYEIWVANIAVEANSLSTPFSSMDRSAPIERLLTAPYCQTSYGLTSGNYPGDATLLGATSAFIPGIGADAARTLHGLGRSLIRMRAQPSITWWSPDTGDVGKVSWNGEDFTVVGTELNNRVFSGVPRVTGLQPSTAEVAYAHMLAESEI